MEVESGLGVMVALNASVAAEVCTTGQMIVDVVILYIQTPTPCR